MLKGQILFNAGSAPIAANKIRSFGVTQNNSNVTIHEVDFERNGYPRRLLFMNFVEATLKGSRYVQAQSKREFCAKLELLDE